MMKEIEKRIDEILKVKKAKKLTLKQLVVLSNVPESTIKRIFAKNTENPRSETLISLEKAVGLYQEEESDEIEDAFCEIKPKDAIDFWDSKGQWARFSVTPEDWERFYKFVESVALEKAGKKYW